MKEVKLENSDLVALVDDEDYERVRQHKWWLQDNGYAGGWQGKKNRPLLHRFVLELSRQDPKVDHKDRNRLNCTRDNLRLCTDQQNSRNQGKRQVGNLTSQYKGVSWEKRYGKWRATIFDNYRQIYAGVFSDEVDAAHAYDAKAIAIFGEFAQLNFPDFDYSTYKDPVKKRGEPTSSYPGVNRMKNGRWRARVNVGGKRVDLGVHATEDDAIRACEDFKRRLSEAA